MRSLLADKVVMSWAFFTASDLNGNGLIDPHEFHLAVAGMRGGLSRDVCDQVFDEFDEDVSLAPSKPTRPHHANLSRTGCVP